LKRYFKISLLRRRKASIININSKNIEIFDRNK